jgi:flagellar protein FlaG
MNSSAGLTDVRIDDPRLSVTRTSPEATPPNMEDRVTIQPSPAEAAPATQVPVRKADQEPQRDELEQIVQEINQEYSMRNISLRFTIDDKSGSLIIKVLDTANDKVIRQIPPEAIVAIRRRMRAVVGDIFDAEA